MWPWQQWFTLYCALTLCACVYCVLFSLGTMKIFFSSLELTVKRIPSYIPQHFRWPQKIPMIHLAFLQFSQSFFLCCLYEEISMITSSSKFHHWESGNSPVSTATKTFFSSIHWQGWWINYHECIHRPNVSYLSKPVIMYSDKYSLVFMQCSSFNALLYPLMDNGIW